MGLQFDYPAAKESHDRRLREAEQERLIRSVLQAQRQRTGRHSLAAPALARLGRGLIVLGRRLQLEEATLADRRSMALQK